jgi:exonuclease VII large subunit
MSLRGFLENLEIGESKVKLSSEDVKNILAESGKVVDNEKQKIEEQYKKDIDNYKTTIEDLKGQIENAPSSEDMENLKQKITEFEEKETARIEKEKELKAEETLNNNILAVFGDKKFSSDYAKNGLLSDIKTEMKKEENQGKGIKDIFEELTKDRSDIFANPNQFQDMPPMGDIDNTISKETFDKMSYKERLEMKQTNPELFEKYNK